MGSSKQRDGESFGAPEAIERTLRNGLLTFAESLVQQTRAGGGVTVALARLAGLRLTADVPESSASVMRVLLPAYVSLVDFYVAGVRVAVPKVGPS